MLPCVRSSCDSPCEKHFVRTLTPGLQAKDDATTYAGSSWASQIPYARSYGPAWHLECDQQALFPLQWLRKLVSFLAA